MGLVPKLLCKSWLFFEVFLFTENIKFVLIKAVVNTVGGLLASRRVCYWLPFVFLFLFDKLRQKHRFKSAVYTVWIFI